MRKNSIRHTVGWIVLAISAACLIGCRKSDVFSTVEASTIIHKVEGGITFHGVETKDNTAVKSTNAGTEIVTGKD